MGTLGYKDSGGICLSKSEALRQSREDDGKPKSNMQVYSRRKHVEERVRDVRDDKQREEATDFEMDMKVIVSKKPEWRLRWMTKALIHVGRKHIKANTFYEIVMDEGFARDLHPLIGARMKASLLGNLHLFSSKQQKMLQSETNHFNNFKDEKKKKDKSSKKKRRERSSSSYSDDPPPKKSSRHSSEDPPPPKKSSRHSSEDPPPKKSSKRSAQEFERHERRESRRSDTDSRRDERMYAKGAADDAS